MSDKKYVIHSDNLITGINARGIILIALTIVALASVGAYVLTPYMPVRPQKQSITPFGKKILDVEINDGVLVEKQPGKFGFVPRQNSDFFEMVESALPKWREVRPKEGVAITAWCKVNAAKQQQQVARNPLSGRSSLFSHHIDSGAMESGFSLGFFAELRVEFGVCVGFDEPLRFPSLKYMGANLEPEYDGVWVHYAGSYGNGMLSIYVNGKVVAEDQMFGPLDYTPEPLGVFIGATKDDNELHPFYGELRHLTVWDGPLTPAMIVNDYLATQKTNRGRPF